MRSETPARIRLVLPAAGLLIAAAAFGAQKGKRRPPRPAAGQAPAGFRVETLLEGLDQASTLKFAPDGRLFFTEKDAGRIRVWKEGRLLPEPFATCPGILGAPGEAIESDERGLLGLAFAPDFRESGRLYAFWTRRRDQCIARFRAQPANADRAAGEPEIILEGFPNRVSNHKGGDLEFGPDGKLYATLGDDEDRPRSQDPAAWNGKILRVNPDGSGPDDNPMRGRGGEVAPRVFALGFRNPFRIAFDGESGRLFASENGPERDDEVNRVVSGGNYGWPEATGKAGGSGREPALCAYSPPPSLTGIAVYRGGGFPEEYGGSLFVAAWNGGAIRRLVLSADGGSVEKDEAFATGLRNAAGDGPADLAVGPDGALYVSTCTRTRLGADRIFRISWVGPGR